MSDDVGGLADAINGVLERPDAALERARRLRDAVGRRFTVETMTDDVCAFYAESGLMLAA